MTRTLAELTDGQIRKLLLKGINDPRTLAFMRELYDCADPEEIPATLRLLARAAEALKHLPNDFDLMSLSFDELNELLGGSSLPLEIPGITDRFPEAFKIPLHELDRRLGAAEASYYARTYCEQLDAETAMLNAQRAEFVAAIDAALAAKYDHP